MQEKDSDSINSNKNDTEFLKYSLENMRNSILNSKDRWTGFLRSSAYLYKYDFESQLSLYALSPKARADSENKDVILANLRACASKEQWQRLGANINETAKSVPILKSDGSLSYVYDVSDTDSDIKIWQPYDTPEFYSVLSKHMNTAEKDLKSMIDDRIYNFVMKTDFANGWPIGKNFQLNSIKYIVYTRCGIDIKGIDSSNMNCCSLFGGDFKSAESNILLPAKTILREIEKSVREYENIIKDRVNEQTVQPETQQVSEKTQEPTQEKQPIRQRNSRPTQRNNTRNNNNSHRRSYTNEEIQAARNTDLVDFLTRQGEQLKKVGTKEYTLPEHDSMRISGSKFYWNSQSFGGNAIDFCLKYYGMSFQEAVSRLLDYNSYSLDLQAQPVSKPKEETKPKPPVKPIPNPLDTNRNRIIEYLTKTRGISPDIVHELIVKDKLAQDIMGNAVFKIFDIEGTLTGAEIVGTQPEKRFKELTEQKGNTFIFNSSLIYPTSAIFFESAIDAISYYNLHRNETSLLVSMAGLKQQAVLNVMDRYGIKAENCLISADNDDKGRNFMKKMKDEYNINSYPITVDGRFYSYENIKDWNDLLKVEAEKNRKLRNEFIKNYFDSNEIFAPSLASDEMTSVAEEFFNYDNSWHSVSNSIADIAARYRNGENVYESSDWVKAFGSSAFTQNIMLTGDEKRANGFDFGFIEFTVETGDEGITFRYEDMEKFFSWEDFGKGQFNYIKAYFRDDIENEYNYETQPVFNNYGEEPYDLWVDASEREKSEERLERLLKRIDGKELNLNPVGKFYELYGREAQTAAEVLGLKLTEKVIGDVKTPMIGFPNFTLKDNIKKLTDLGYIYNIKEDPSVISALEKYNPLYLKDNTDEQYVSNARRSVFKNNRIISDNGNFKLIADRISPSATNDVVIVDLMNLSTAAIYISTENLEIDYSRSERENSAQIEQEKEAALSEDNNIFEYQGYHFKPIGNFLSKDDFNSLSRNIVSHSSPYMSVYEDSEIAYFRNDFYRASNNSKADVFLCVETGKIFTPGENMLFEFTGEHEPIPEIEKTVLSEEQQENAAEPKAETGLSDNSMPDISITADDRNKYGYTSDDLLPLNTEKALELFDKGVPVYLLYIDNTEALAENRAEIESFDGIFGIEVGEWEKSLQIEQTRNNKKETELLHQPAISKNDVQIEQNKTDDRTASPKSSENTVSKPLKQTQQEQKTERKKGIIGNTTYRYIPKKRYRKFDVDTAEKIADAFEKAGLKYSGVVGESTTTLTFSGNDIEKAETIIEQVKNNESAKENTNAVENISSTSETSKSKTAKNSKVENKEKEAAPTITLEDIDSVLKNGSGFKSGKYRIYRQFQKQEKSKANTDFLKKEYGTGSGTHNFSDGIQGWTNFDTKGISITKYGDYDNPDVKLNWSQAEKQIKKLISEDRYFTDEDNKKYPEYLKSVNAPQYEIDNFIKSVHQKFIQSKSKLPPAEKRDSLSLRLSDFIRYLDGYEQGLLKEVGRTDLANISADEMETRLSEPETVQQLLDFLKKVQGATSDAYSRSNAWYFRQELSQLYPMQYICKADDIVYIDSEKYEVLEADNNNFILRNAEMALDTRTLSFDELQKQLSGNTANDIYKRVIPENSTQNIAQNQQINIASAPTVEQSQNKAANINVNSILGQSFSQNIIDLFLQQGSNTDNARMVIATEFMKQKPIEEIAESLKTVYHGGFGIQAGNRAVSAWYDEDGIHLSAGKTARYNRNAQVISWVEAAERIGQLLNEGTFESNVELAEADGYEREQLAEKVLHLYRDISDEGKEQNLFLSLKTALSGVSAGFPEQKSFLKAKLDDSEFRKALSADFDVFKTAYNQDRNVLRFHYHKVDSIDRDLKELELPRIGFESNMTAVPAVNEFITDDEINADLARGSGVEGGKGRIYNYFTKNHTLQEKADYIKNEYGIGGHSHALSGSTGSDQWHDPKGINYKKKNCKDVKMSWSQAAKRISEIIEKNNYLSKEEKNLPKEKPDKEQEISIEPPLRNNVNNDITEEKSHDNGIDEAVQNKTESTSYIPIYKNTGKYAAENNEMDMFRASNKENRKCREAIENAIKENFNGMYLDPKAVDGVIDKFGTDRVSYLLAATIKAKKDYDKRFSNSNIKWADSVDTSFRRPDSFSEIISSHSAILDGFIRLFRESIEKDRELAKPNKEKTFEDVAENVNKPVEYFTPTVKAVINDLSNSTDKRYYVRIWSSTDGKNYSDTGNGRYFNDLEMAKNFATEIIDGKYNDIIAFTAKYDEIYKELEDNPEKLNEYKVNGNDFDEAVNNDSYKYYLKYISVRGDDFTGDREQTAFVLALNEISRQKYLGSEKKEEAEAIAEPITDTVKEKIADKPENFRITDYDFTSVKPRDKFRDNVNAIRTLFAVESENRQATPEEQEILSKYVGWGGLADAFDAGKYSWISEYNELKNLLPEKQYNSARASVTDSFYTPPVVISSIYKALKNVGFEGGRILEPSMGVGNFFGMLPEDLRETSKLYGVEIDDISGRIAKLLYPNANIQIKGFEDTSFNSNSFDLAVGNVPFGNIRITDRDFKERNLIHDYFFKKSLDRVRPGGVVAFITSKGTLDKKDNSVRKYLAERADLIGAIRLPDNVFKRNAGTEVTSDIIFLQKREFPRDLEKEPLPDWVNVSANLAGIEMNSYFIENPQMVLGEMQEVSGRFGTRVICSPYENADLSELLDEAVSHIKKIEPNEIIDEVTVENTDISQNDIITENASGNETVSESQNLADDNDNKAVSENKDNDGPSTVFEDEDFENEVDPMGHRNFCYDIVDGKIYFRENDMMKKQDLKSFHTKDAFERLSGMIEISKCLQELIRFQLENYEDEYIVKQQKKLNKLYDDFTAKYGLLSSRSNKNIFKDDDTAPLLQSLENLNEKGELESKADIFTKRTIIPYTEITSVDTASEALAVSISEKAKVDLDFMSELCSKPKDEIVNELEGVIFENPFTKKYETADEYLSGNVRKKLADTEKFVKVFKEQAEKYTSNIEALKKVQPADLLPSEIFVQLGSTWIPPKYYEEFMYDLLETPDRCKSDNISFCNRNPFLSSGRHSSRSIIAIDYNEHSATFAISNKSNYAADSNNMLANKTYGTDRKNAYQILEDSLNMKQVKIFDYYEDIDGKKKAVLNQKETILAQNKQTLIKNKFKEWIFDDAKRTKELCRLYNDKFNCDNPRQYNGEHINFVGMNPEITLREHQRNAIAHTLYGGNTLLAHVVGSGKTYEMVASAMESKRLGLCHKSLIVVPKAIVNQFAKEFMQLYPAANILVPGENDFSEKNRRKFCSRISTGNYDAIIISHNQFERIPLSKERQIEYIQNQIDEIIDNLEELKRQKGERGFTVKELESTKKNLQNKLKALNNDERRDTTITFEELGVDKLYVDEAHMHKNLFFTSKMGRNVAGVNTSSNSQRATDLQMKCQYLDEITGSKGVVFATGTPVSNSIAELFTMQRYLQNDKLKELHIDNFDSWASTYAETKMALELAPEGKGYQMKTRFAKFSNLPELMNMFKEIADVKTGDVLNLPVPEAHFHTISAEASQHQKDMVDGLAKRAEKIRNRLVDPTEDNMLAVTNDGRKLALDQRLMNPLLPDEPNSKINMCVENVFKIWQDEAENKSTQIIFSDLSTPNTTGFNVYDDIKKKLIDKGIPQEQIAFIHDCKTDVQKQNLFTKVNNGEVRVLLGSTSKLGTGVNCQKRLKAAHHVDCPWKPADLARAPVKVI